MWVLRFQNIKQKKRRGRRVFLIANLFTCLFLLTQLFVFGLCHKFETYEKLPPSRLSLSISETGSRSNFDLASLQKSFIFHEEKVNIINICISNTTFSNKQCRSIRQYIRRIPREIFNNFIQSTWSRDESPVVTATLVKEVASPWTSIIRTRFLWRQKSLRQA